MSRPNPIRAIMEDDLPDKTYQRKKLFRPDYDYVKWAYKTINRYIFDNELHLPPMYLGRLTNMWGYCQWHNSKTTPGTHCTIHLSDKWFCEQWFIQTLAHEMVHQYQWDIYRFQHLNETGKMIPIHTGAHGPSFYAWRDAFSEYGLNLKLSYGQKRWFKYQDFTRC